MNSRKKVAIITGVPFVLDRKVIWVFSISGQ